MKIALLNLPLDNNYGGNLQRYALMTMLQSLGHDVTHIFLKVQYSLPWYKYPYSYTKRIIKKYLLRLPIHIREEHYKTIEYEKSLDPILPFYKKYVKHTAPCYNLNDILSVTMGKFDAYIVGSDQVWRKDMTRTIGLENFFLKFADQGKKRIAYSVSFGSDRLACSKAELQALGKLFRLFSAVSVREISCLAFFDKAGWSMPKPQLTLDPVLLLDKRAYIDIINDNSCHQETVGKCFCYILDYNESVDKEIERIEEVTNTVRYVQKLTEDVSLPQWIANIYYSRQVITDSYHGVVLSILFDKPFFFLGNKRRGNARVDSLFIELGIDKTSTLDPQWSLVHEKLAKLKEVSINYLKNI